MENNEYQNQPEGEEIPNIEQFQVHRTDTHPGEPKEETPTDPDNTGYTEAEIPFADGEGTRLDEEIDDDETNPDNELENDDDLNIDDDLDVEDDKGDDLYK